MKNLLILLLSISLLSCDDDEIIDPQSITTAPTLAPIDSVAGYLFEGNINGVEIKTNEYEIIRGNGITSIMFNSGNYPKLSIGLDTLMNGTYNDNNYFIGTMVKNETMNSVMAFSTRSMSSYDKTLSAYFNPSDSTVLADFKATINNNRWANSDTTEKDSIFVISGKVRGIVL